MDKMKTSDDYIKLRKLLNSGYKPNEINIQIGKNSANATIFLQTPNGEIINLKSSEDDVTMFAFSVKSLFDRYGNLALGEVKDLNTFYNDLEALVDRDNKKFHEARRELFQGKVNIEYSPHLLLRQLLEEKSSGKYKTYLRLKTDYYLIKVLHIEEMKIIYDGMQRIRKQKSVKTKIFDLTLNLFKNAFHKDSNFLKNYQLFQKFNKADVMDILISTGKDKKVTDNLFGMLHKRGGVPAEEGLSHIISSYASMAETINKLLNIIRAAIELTEGNNNPKENEKSSKNWIVIKNNPKYSIIVEDFDPRIRHGKAHNNFGIDTDKGVINFYKEGRIKELAVTYTFEQMRVMWHRIHIILSALIVAVCLEQSALTGVVLDSREYKLLLAGLGNFKKI